MSDDAPSLAPVLLVSMPQMADPNFSRSVILLAEYGKDGAFGLVVNRQMAEPAHEVVRAEPPIPIRKDVHLFIGGPVEPTRAWVLTRRRLRRRRDGGRRRRLPVGLAGAVRRALQSPPDPRCGSWSATPAGPPGQLDEELAQSAWLLAPVQRRPDLRHAARRRCGRRRSAGWAPTRPRCTAARACTEHRRQRSAEVHMKTPDR